MTEPKEVETLDEDGDPSVPPELLDLHVQLEVDGVSAEEFKEVYGETGNEG